MPHGYFATTTPDVEEMWEARESELKRTEANLRAIVINNDDYWRPDIKDTVTEMFWDYARVDAAEMAGDLLLKGETIDPRKVAVTTVPEGLYRIPGDTYTGVDGHTILRRQIIEWNIRMIEEMLPRVEEKI